MGDPPPDEGFKNDVDIYEGSKHDFSWIGELMEILDVIGNSDGRGGGVDPDSGGGVALALVGATL